MYLRYGPYGLIIIRFEIMLQLDLFGKKAKNWYEEGAVPSEPFFVARPGATEEDDGNSIFVYLVSELKKCVTL